MKNLHIENSYKIWSIRKMRKKIDEIALKKYGSFASAKVVLNRTYWSMYIEWWLHNLGYVFTKPFCFIKSVRKTNLRFKDVDLDERI